MRGNIGPLRWLHATQFRVPARKTCAGGCCHRSVAVRLRFSGANPPATEGAPLVGEVAPPPDPPASRSLLEGCALPDPLCFLCGVCFRIYIYIYVCVCVCVCVYIYGCVNECVGGWGDTYRPHTHLSHIKHLSNNEQPPTTPTDAPFPLLLTHTHTHTHTHTPPIYYISTYTILPYQHINKFLINHPPPQQTHTPPTYCISTYQPTYYIPNIHHPNRRALPPPRGAARPGQPLLHHRGRGKGAGGGRGGGGGVGVPRRRQRAAVW